MTSPSIAARVTYRPVPPPPVPGFLSLCAEHTQTFFTGEEFQKWMQEADKAVATNPEFKYGMIVEVETPTMPIRKFTINPTVTCPDCNTVYEVPTN